MNHSADFDQYRQMLTIRTVEERLLELFSEGKLSGTVHTCIGQEACAVGVVGALDNTRDIVLSNHRGHGHFMVHSNWNLTGLIGEVMGREIGVCRGIGGSQHLHANNFYSTGVQGSLTAAAAGMAFAEKNTGSGAVVAVFIGDGTLGQGLVYESFNIASKWDLPVLFVVENNRYAQTTPTEVQHSGEITQRAKPFGINTTVIDVNSVSEVRALATEAITQIRTDYRPQLLHLNTYRLAPHSKGDDFRDSDELSRQRKVDPLAVLKSELEDRDFELLNKITSQTIQKVYDAVTKAENSPLSAEGSFNL
jgi:TPP-dependent pyruvate/acetoin dehydrogenase alpha subunit